MKVYALFPAYSGRNRDEVSIIQNEFIKQIEANYITACTICVRSETALAEEYEKIEDGDDVVIVLYGDDINAWFADIVKIGVIVKKCVHVSCMNGKVLQFDRPLNNFFTFSPTNCSTINALCTCLFGGMLSLKSLSNRFSNYDNKMVVFYQDDSYGNDHVELISNIVKGSGFCVNPNVKPIANWPSFKDEIKEIVGNLRGEMSTLVYFVGFGDSYLDAVKDFVLGLTYDCNVVIFSNQLVRSLENEKEVVSHLRDSNIDFYYTAPCRVEVGGHDVLGDQISLIYIRELAKWFNDVARNVSSGVVVNVASSLWHNRHRRTVLGDMVINITGETTVPYYVFNLKEANFEICLMPNGRSDEELSNILMEFNSKQQSLGITFPVGRCSCDIINKCCEKTFEEVKVRFPSIIRMTMTPRRSLFRREENKIERLFGGVLYGDILQVNCDIDDMEGNNVNRLYLVCGESVLPYGYASKCKINDLTSIRVEVAKSLAVAKHAMKSQYDCQNIFSLKEVKEAIAEAVSDSFIGFVYFIPEVNSESDDAGYVMVCASTSLSMIDLSLLSMFINRAFSLISNQDKKFQLYVANTKSAIGSIMSRNGSHNIGSHVLAALSHNVGTMPDDRVLYQYIQHRMDYIATATTDFPSWTYSTPVVSGMMKEFLSQRHLLDYIANSEGLRAYRFQDANMDNSARNNQKNSIRISVSKRTEQNEVVDYITYPYADDNEYRERLANDVSVAIPGGTIGEHAFFTILENVIRNAAKHGWAVRNKQGAARNQNRNEKVENLDIYIEVLDDVTEYPEDVVVTIWDNISDVFAVPDKERNRKDRMLGLKKLKSWIDKNAKVLQKPLDDDKMSVQQLKDYFAGKVVELPNPYRSLVEVLNNPIDEEKEEGLEVWSVLSDILVGRTENDAELGHRLWLPMHHRQQLKLEEPLIDDTGTLRRENWGLAEMKISAGYLQRREIGEIGGLESDKKEQIITAVAKELNGVYHLGYKFKIPRPKELLLALDDGEQNKKFKDADKDLRKALIEQGVYVKRMSEIKFGEEGLKDLSYKYVLLPYFPVNKGDPYLPFRVLTRDEFWGNPNAPGGCIVPSIGEEEYKGVVDLLFNGCDTPKKRAHAILNKVYHHWIDYLVRKRRRLDVKEYPSYPPLYIQTVDNVKSGTNSGNVSAGRCLISDVDIWKVVFSEMFHSVTMNFLKSRKKYKNEGWFALLFLIASWLPRRQEIVLVKEGIKLNDDDIRNKESQMLATQLLKWYDDGIKEVVESNKNLYTNYGVKDSGAKFGEETGYQWPKDIALNKNAIKAAVEDLKKMTAPTGVFADYFATLRAAFVEADVLLRKYEERIITLPNMFSAPTEAVKGGGDVMEDKAIGEVLHLNLIIDDPDKLANEKGKSVDYRRHFKFDSYNAAKQLYAEPLSGTQSYLNSLFLIKDDSSSSGIVSTLYEAGLMRVLIIDERVADFIRKHDGTAETFAKMNMWVVDDKKLLESNVEGTAFAMPESDMSSVKGLLTFNSRNFATFREKFRATWSEEQKSAALLHEQVRAFVATKGARFDMLIIHQGLIDKWFDGASLSEAKMEKFLEYWRDVAPYVVITTGRGTPANTPKTARILPFSVVENTLYKKYPEKLVLVDTIMNILPKGGRK